MYVRSDLPGRIKSNACSCVTQFYLHGNHYVARRRCLCTFELELGVVEGENYTSKLWKLYLTGKNEKKHLIESGCLSLLCVAGTKGLKYDGAARIRDLPVSVQQHVQLHVSQVAGRYLLLAVFFRKDK